MLYYPLITNVLYTTNKIERFSFKGGHVIQVAKHLKRLVYNSVATGSGRPGHLGHLLSGSKWVDMLICQTRIKIV